jgi:magnesium-transporting ATPase (P-type)
MDSKLEGSRRERRLEHQLMDGLVEDGSKDGRWSTGISRDSWSAVMFLFIIIITIIIITTTTTTLMQSIYNYLRIYQKQTVFLRYIQCCSCSVFTVCATCNVIYSLCYM